MNKRSQNRFDILVIGAGPAGMATAARAADCGARVGIVDDNAALGGQIWRGSAHTGDSSAWISRVQSTGVTKLFGARVFDQPEPGVLLAERENNLVELRYQKLVVATGARERFLPFPGWTLPNVMGAGGLQALVKSGLPMRGKRVIVAGTGPLLLAVASYLRKQGAEIVLVCEQASWSTLARFGTALIGFPEKIRQSLQLRKEVAGIPFAAQTWPVEAAGTHMLESVTISRAGKHQTLSCDYMACGFHLVPNVELAVLLGCKLSGGFVQVDEFQQTSVNGIFCSGEPTGIGGLESALVEGQIAGLAAAGQAEKAQGLFAQRRKARRFGILLDKTFQLRTELKELPQADTIVCRCEDVPYARLQSCISWRAAKLHTRCGMGPCQGRICGSAAEFLFHWKPDSVRPPVFPARVDSLAGSARDAEPSTISGGIA
jgi:NADPH-dependent 2,4-dienoyl-CoA reductase/sulfur reductase-like enzyme